jgi:glycosyltransferase involved in cell wall biosynthesis
MGSRQGAGADPAELWILDPGQIAGGGQRFALRLATAAERGKPNRRVRVLCPRSSVLGRWCVHAGHDVVDIGFPAFHPREAVAIVRALRRLRKVLRAAPPRTVVVANAARISLYCLVAWPARSDLRAVHVMHEQDSARRCSASFALRRFGSLVVVGDNAARAYRENVGVTPTAVNNFLLPEQIGELATVRRPRNGSPRKLGVLGRLIPEKGILELVQELAAPGNRDSFDELLVAAFPEDPEYEAALRLGISDLGLQSKVRLVGPRDDVPAFLSELEALVVPSVGTEAQPTVILEALAAGVPVLVREPVWASAFDGLPVAAYRSAEDLTRALSRLSTAQVPVDELERRFGPARALEAIDGAGASEAPEHEHPPCVSA